MSTAFETEQARQGNQLLSEIGNVLAKLGKSYGELNSRQQREFAQHAQAISKLSDDVTAVKAGYLKRFGAMVSQYGPNGDPFYRGHYQSREHARQAGRFFLAVCRKDFAAVGELQREWAQAGLFGMHEAAVQPSSGPSGGYLVAEEMIEGIIRNVEQYGVFEQDAMRFEVGSQTGRISKRTAGLTVLHPDYGETMTDSQPTFAQITPNLTSYAVPVFVDNTMLQDQLAVALAEFIAVEMAQALAEAQDTYAFTGDGTVAFARVQGAFNRSSGADVTAASGDNTFQEVIDKSTVYLGQLLGGMPQWADMDDGLKFYGHRSILFGYMGLRDAQDRPLVDLFANERGLDIRLMRYPFRVTQVAPTLAESAASTPMLLAANLRKGWGLVRHRAGVEFKTSEHVRFLQNQLALLMMVRQDIVQLDENAQARLITNAA